MSAMVATMMTMAMIVEYLGLGPSLRKRIRRWIWMIIQIWETVLNRTTQRDLKRKKRRCGR